MDDSATFHGRYCIVIVHISCWELRCEETQQERRPHLLAMMNEGFKEGASNRTSLLQFSLTLNQNRNHPLPPFTFFTEELSFFEAYEIRN